jgi:hypothetical protein
MHQADELGGKDFSGSEFMNWSIEATFRAS